MCNLRPTQLKYKPCSVGSLAWILLGFPIHALKSSASLLFTACKIACVKAVALAGQEQETADSHCRGSANWYLRGFLQLFKWTAMWEQLGPTFRLSMGLKEEGRKREAVFMAINQNFNILQYENGGQAELSQATKCSNPTAIWSSATSGISPSISSLCCGELANTDMVLDCLTSDITAYPVLWPALMLFADPQLY